MRYSTFLGLVTVAVLAASATSQPVQQDLVLTSDSNPAGVYYTSYGPWSPLRTLDSSLITSGVKMACKNYYLYVIGGNTGNIYQLTSLGARRTVTSATPPGGAALALDQDCSYMVACPNDGRLYRVKSSTVTTFATIPSSRGRPNAICRHGYTGDWLVGMTATGDICRIDRVTGKELGRFHSGNSVSSILGLADMPRYNQVVAVRSRIVTPPYPGKTIQELVLMSSYGSITDTLEIKDASAVAVNHKTGSIFVATSSGSVVEVRDRFEKLEVVESLTYGTHGFTGIDIWGDQNVSPNTSGERGAQVTVYVRFFRSQKMPYVVALSLGQSRGIRFNCGNILNLDPDPVFYLTAGGALPYFTSGFAGTTSVSGLAHAYFTIPWSIPVGTCMYVGAVAVNPAFRDGLDVGNSECIQVK